MKILSLLLILALPATADVPIGVIGVNVVQIDTSPEPAAFVGWCPTCAGHMLVGAQHDAIKVTRPLGGAEMALGGAWLYAPGTTGTLATGGAVVATAGVSVGSSVKAALSQVPAAAEAVGAASPAVNALQYAVKFNGFVGPRVGGANGIPSYPYGVGAVLSIKYSYAAITSLFTK